MIPKLIDGGSKVIKVVIIQKVMDSLSLTGIKVANPISILILNSGPNIALTLLIVILNISNLLNISQYLLLMLLINGFNLFH